MKALHGLVSTLRNRLEPDRGSRGTPGVLVTGAAGYALGVALGRVDAFRFRCMVELAAAAPISSRADLLRAALELWKGPALDEFAYEPFAQGAIADLTELRLTALEQRIECDLGLGRHGQVVAELEGLVAEHPFRERLLAELMLAVYRCGRQADALGAFREGPHRMIEEFGIEPGLPLQALELSILTHDVTLAAPAFVAGPAARRKVEEQRPWLANARKTVSVVVVELSDDAAAGSPADPEALRLAVGRAYEAVAAVVDRHGGTVEGMLGDVVVAVFGVPVAHEDDAERAVRAAARASA